MTPHRDFRDDDDHIWTAWDVIPSWGERRYSERRRLDLGAPSHSGERRRTDRRIVRGIRVPLTPVLAKGWLAFESGEAHKRLAPIPPDWQLLPEEKLRELLRVAEPLPKRRRRLVE